MHADRSNRAALIVVAALLTALGALGVATSYGLLGTSIKHKRLVDNGMTRFIGRNSEWFWVVVALVALLAVLLALRWLVMILFSTDRTSTIRINAGGGTGPTELATGALTDAVAGEIDTYPGVDTARARVIGDPQDAELVVVVTLEQQADLPALAHRIRSRALDHARTALGNPAFPVTLDLTVTSKRAIRIG